MLLQIAEILLSPTASDAPVIMSLILRSYIGKALQEKIDCSEVLIYSTKKTICSFLFDEAKLQHKIATALVYSGESIF